MQNYKFECGCELPIVGDSNNKSPIPRLDIDFYNLRLDCPGTWELIGTGMTKGIFQVESQLGKHWSKEIKPSCIEDISAIGALLRPGCLKSFYEGKSMTQHYADRKNGIESPTPYHPAVDKVLEDTFSVLCYQEQSMRLAVAVAGFTEVEADMLRKAIGKKKADEMAKVKKMFLDKANTAGIVSKEQAEEIFGWIESSQRYAFNKSHSVEYGMVGYWTAYAKYHHMNYFLTSNLVLSKNKLDTHEEVRDLVSEARFFEIPISQPSIITKHKNFHTDGQTITFGLNNIKNVGESVYNKMITKIPLGEALLSNRFENWSWMDILLVLSPHINSKAFTSMIMTGCFDYLVSHGHRSELQYQYEKFLNLSDVQLDWILSKHIEKRYKSLIDAIIDCAKVKKEGGGCHDKRGVEKLHGIIQSLIKPPYSLQDSPDRIMFEEQSLLGSTITYTISDTCDDIVSNTSCKELLQGKDDKYMAVLAKISKCKEHTVSKGKSAGQKMCFLTINDGICSIDLVCFNDKYKVYKPLLVEDNTVTIRVSRSKQKSLIVEKVSQC